MKRIRTEEQKARQRELAKLRRATPEGREKERSKRLRLYANRTEEQKEKGRARDRRRNLKRKDKQVAYKKEWDKRNPEKKKAYSDTSRIRNADKIKERNRVYRQTHKAQASETSKRWVKANPERQATRTKRWKTENKDKYRVSSNNYQNRRYKTDPEYKIWRTMRSRFQDYFERSRTGKKTRSLKSLIGCDGAWLMAWLEVQFKPGMTFDNYAYDTWHIDHIRPVSTFKVDDQEDQKRAWHWTNLQPMWGADNLRKSAKWSAEDAA